MTIDLREVGLLLWRGSFSERTAVGIFNILQRGRLLRPEERADVEEFTADEIRHGDALRQAARQYLPARPTNVTPYDFVDQPEHLLLATLTLAERFSAPGFLRATAVFHRLGDHDTAAAYIRLDAEEQRHIAWGKNVLQRIRRTEPKLAADIRAYLHSRTVLSMYRQVQDERRWL